MSLSISVVIPTHQRAQSLLRVLDALGRQQCVDLEQVQVVVVCDGIGDPALQILQRTRYPMRVTLAEQQRQGPAAARNHAIALCTGALIAFLDDDVIPGEDFLRVHLRAHEEDDQLVAIGPLLTPPGHGTPWVRWEGQTVAKQYAAMARGDWAVSPRQFYTGNASVRRVHLVEASGFDVTFLRGEDVELAFRLQDRGLHFLFLPEAIVEHRAVRSYSSWLSTAESYGHVDVRLARDRHQQGLLDAVAREFRALHPITRWLGRTSIRRPLVARVSAWAARPIAVVADRLHIPRVGEIALSGAFNAVRLTGFAAELGGGSPALSLLNDGEVRRQGVPSASGAPQEPGAMPPAHPAATRH